MRIFTRTIQTSFLFAAAAAGVLGGGAAHARPERSPVATRHAVITEHHLRLFIRVRAGSFVAGRWASSYVAFTDLANRGVSFEIGQNNCVRSTFHDRVVNPSGTVLWEPQKLPRPGTVCPQYIALRFVHPHQTIHWSRRFLVARPGRFGVEATALLGRGPHSLLTPPIWLFGKAV
ncbi:MAG TPA: hypothetical protein VG815_20525 [Chloroflexota bacterium]|nr:hypothetical protein [Chloroflexota bacterium]